MVCGRRAVGFLLAVMVFLFSCVKEIKIENRTGERKLVAEGMITNEATPYSVRLSYLFELDNYIGIGEIPYAENANVQISDDAGNSTSMEYMGKGLYQTTDPDFIGVIGRSYALAITTEDGKSFASKPEKLLPVPPIDSVYTDYLFHGPALGEGYDVYLDFTDPGGVNNYYRWTAYSYSVIRSYCPPCPPGQLCGTCNEFCWLRTDGKKLDMVSDQLFDGRVVKGKKVFFSPAYVNNAHLVEVQQMSMSKEAYGFWQKYLDQQNRVGSIFDPAPASIRGNIVGANDVNDIQLGYFFVSSVARKKYTFIDPVLQYVQGIYAYPSLLPIGDCEGVYPGATLQRPGGW